VEDIRPLLDLSGDPAARLAATITLWRLGAVRSEEVVDDATDALVAGLDSPTLRLLAGVRRADAPAEVDDLITSVVEELGLPEVELATAFDDRVRRILVAAREDGRSGRATVAQVRMAYRRSSDDWDVDGWTRPGVADLMSADEEYELIADGGSPTPVAAMDSMVDRVIRALLG
jgi:hypothetical protein